MFRRSSLAVILLFALILRARSQEVTIGHQIAKVKPAPEMVEVITERSIAEHIEEEKLPVADLPKAKPEKIATTAPEPVVRPKILSAPTVVAENAKPKPSALSQPSPAKELQPSPILTSGPIETAFVKLADGFDFPVGKPDAVGYYKARGYRPNGHQGEDWDGVRGGDTDLGDAIYSIGEGIVVFARDVHLGWGNVVIVRYAYRDNGETKNIDALYGHLDTMLVKRGQRVARGEKIATMGNAHGQYDAHLHFEIRKNLEIGMSRSAFRRDFSNYFDPTDFILAHRRLERSGRKFPVAMNTFTHDARFNFDARDFAPRNRSTAQSSAALRQAVAETAVR